MLSALELLRTSKKTQSFTRLLLEILVLASQWRSSSKKGPDWKHSFQFILSALELPLSSLGLLPMKA